MSKIDKFQDKLIFLKLNIFQKMCYLYLFKRT